MNKAYLEHFPVVLIKAKDSLCDQIPENICDCFPDCMVCPFNSRKSQGCIILLVVKENTENE